MEQPTQEQDELRRLPDKEMAYLVANPNEFPNISRENVLAESNRRLEAADRALADQAAVDEQKRKSPFRCEGCKQYIPIKVRYISTMPGVYYHDCSPYQAAAENPMPRVEAPIIARYKLVPEGQTSALEARYAALVTASQAIMDEMPDCNCDAVYTTRKRRDPHCLYHSLIGAEEIEGLRAALAAVMPSREVSEKGEHGP